MDEDQDYLRYNYLRYNYLRDNYLRLSEIYQDNPSCTALSCWNSPFVSRFKYFLDLCHDRYLHGVCDSDARDVMYVRNKQGVAVPTFDVAKLGGL